MKIGYCFTGSFCTFEHSIKALEVLVSRGYEVIPIMSENAYYMDTRFQLAEEFSTRVEALCQNRVIHTVVDAEPLGPSVPLDALIVAPCTGNTLAKVARGITDTAATMAIKAHLRRDRPLLIALASNDAMSQNLASIAAVLNRKAVYFVPMVQDSPTAKPHSLVADMSLIPTALDSAMRAEQLRPIFR
jgi:dipicolinate synthase subunit B